MERYEKAIHTMSKERNAGEILELGPRPAIIAVIGCGGKTTLIEALARQYAHQKVLISPTTKQFPLLADDIIRCDTLQKCAAHHPVNGIQCLGIKNPQSGKLEALPMKLLEAAIPHYEIALLEADGSKGLPLKGWADFEPVIPPFCTHTIGIIPANAIGLPVSHLTVHRMELFTRLTGLSVGERATPRGVSDMICKPGGMFRRGVGKQYLFINQAESPEAILRAKALADEALRHCGAAFSGIAYGSARLNKWTEVKR